MTIAPEYVDEQLRMPWPVICRMACQSMILNMTLDEFADAALRRYIDAMEAQ